MWRGALTSVSHLVRRHPAKWKVASSIPIRACAWVVGLVLATAGMRGNQPIFLCHTDVSLFSPLELNK